eukprot:UN05529
MKGARGQPSKRGFEGGLSEKYREQLKNLFGDNSDDLLKLHVERELLNGLEVESNLFYKDPQKSKVVIDIFRGELEGVFNRENIDDLFDTRTSKKELSISIAKLFTRETFLYKVLTKTQRELTNSKILTLGPYNEVFNKSLHTLRQPDR